MIYSLVAGICGAAVMALEILGSRLLAPDFGSSIYVWGSLIGTFLAALSLGYWLGGITADRRPSMQVLGWFVTCAAAYTVALPAVAGTVTGWASALTSDERWGSLVSSVILFVVPGAFLGTVSPFLIRLSARSLKSTGSVAGGIYAVSTVGSIAGTFLTSFYLIAVLPVSRILVCIGAVLLLLGCSLIIGGVQAAKKAGVLVVVLLAVWPACARCEVQEVYRTDSLYHHIRVVDEDGVRYLMFGRTSQSALLLEDPLASVFPYVDAFHLGPLIKPCMQRVLFIGLGGGTGPRQFRETYPNLTVDVAEIDPEVLRIARRFFGLRTDDRLRVTVRDGRMFLRRSSDKYDMIVLDAYYADGVPFHLTTREFMRMVKDRLTPGGVVMANTIGSIQGRRSDLVRSEYRTMRAVFGHCLFMPVPEPEDNGELRLLMRRNIMLVCVNGRPPSWSDLHTRLKNAPKRYSKGLEQIIRAAEKTTPPKMDDVPLLTDDYAPVDNLIRVD
ncbi:MAG: fused MFS/spermidine synthase [Armatimonadota bacterium]